MEKYINQVHIFMSATIKDFEKIYINTYRNFLPDHPLPQVFEKLYHLHIEYYHNAYAHPVYNIVLYRNEEYLLDRIQKTEGQKWLIFVSSKDNGATLKQIISKICGRKCYFLKAQNKNNAVWNKLIDNGCYDKDILITTKVLDNGVNIKDSNVTNVVLPFCDSTDFIQMIGRKRFQNESEKITVYVRQPKIQEITAKINSIIEKFVFCDMLQRDEYNINQKQNIVKTYWKRPEYNNLFDFKIIFQKTDIDLQTNYLAMYKLDTLLVFYSKLKQFHNNTQMHIDFLNMWLKGQIASIRHELIPPNISNLEEFLEENTNRNITDMEPFYQSFIELYNMYCYNIFITANNDEERFEKALSFRKGKTQRKATINRSLNFLGLPYKLDKKNNCWILHKLPR